MSNKPEKTRLISHTTSPDILDDIIQKTSQRIKQEGDKPYATVTFQLDLLTQLNQFDLGRYLLQNKGINGYWTHYILTYPWFGKKTGKNNRGEPLTPLEQFLLERAPIILATQQRFNIFLKENQKQVHSNTKLASIPCGMMGELLYLDYKNISHIDLIGIDYDDHALEDAQTLAKQRDVLDAVKLYQQDAWDLKFENEFNLVSSNGLNIYESDDEKVEALYQQFHKALKPHGKLVTSFLTPPPTMTKHCEWDFSEVNQDDLLLQKIVISDIVGAKWQCYRSSEQTYHQLKSVGFENIEFIYDAAKIFPTVIAYKK